MSGTTAGPRHTVNFDVSTSGNRVNFTASTRLSQEQLDASFRFRFPGGPELGAFVNVRRADWTLVASGALDVGTRDFSFSLGAEVNFRAPPAPVRWFVRPRSCSARG